MEEKRHQSVAFVFITFFFIAKKFFCYAMKNELKNFLLFDVQLYNVHKFIIKFHTKMKKIIYKIIKKRNRAILKII